MNTLLKRTVWLVIAAPVIYLAITWSSLPERVAIHFNLSGIADRYAGKSSLFGVTAILMAVNVGVYLLLSNFHRIDTRKSAVENKDKLQRIAFAVSVFISAILCFILYSSRYATMPLNAKWILVGVGLLFSMLGNYLYTIKPNYFAGLRLPWTLNNEENWRRTHLLAGKLWFGGGLLTAVICIFLPLVPALICFGIIILIITIVPGVYSYRLYKEGNGEERQ